MLIKLYLLIGRIAHRYSRPLLRLYLRRTERAYVILCQKDTVLLLKNWYGDGQWALPGGGLRKGETPEAAAIREVREELKISLFKKDLRLLTEGNWTTHKLGYTYFIYLCATPVKQFSIQRPEIVEAQWISKNDIKGPNYIIEIKRAVKRIDQIS
ncbi:MAG TPA: NUDIX hydrolase [Candidatus Saccharimonadales bacterium]|nr:NUDIX hydrolase [Candidatus Saccharimonadales bacterium]